jgi:ketosteroid isomerase-like protein
MTSVDAGERTGSERVARVVARELIDAISALDFESVQALIHPDVEVIEPDSLPYGGRCTGREEFFAGVVGVLAANFELTVTGVTIMEADARRAASSMTIEFKARRSGAAIAMPYVEIYDVRDGLVAKIDVYPQDAARLADFMAAEAGLGAGGPRVLAGTTTETRR